MSDIVCLCGSTKFKEVFEKATLEESLKGNIVLSVCCFSHHDNLVWTDEIKERFDKLHLEKIDMSDFVLVLNVGGYIGESTRKEIDYAVKKNKRIEYLEYKKK